MCDYDRELRPRGVTLIEVVVAMGILSILIALLIPAIKKDREEARSVHCLSNLHELGRAVLVYAHGNGDTLPGPINPLLSRNVPAEEGGTQLSHFVSSEKKEIELFDRVAICPTVELMNQQRTSGRTGQIAHYIANTGAFPRPDLPNVVHLNPEDPPCTSERPALALSRYVTEPPNYFGYVDPRRPTAGAVETGDQDYQPKALSRIDKASSEWMIADLWAWDVYACDRAYPVGTWPYELDSPASSAIRDGQELAIPTAPFHKSLEEYLDRVAPSSPVNCKQCCPSQCGPQCICRRAGDQKRLESGVTNAVYFDGHADSVRNWRGTANPRAGMRPCLP